MEKIKKFQRSHPNIFLLIVVSIWRLILFTIAFISAKQFTFDPKFPYSQSLLIESGLPQWLWAWGNFDGIHYLTIAQRGYFAQFTQAFFPLYPLLLRMSAYIFQDKYMIVTGLLLSFAFFAAALLLMRKLLHLDRDDTGGRKRKLNTNRVILAVLIFPTSFYFGALYTESLFLLLVLAAFWFARQKKWWLSGLFGAAASATKITGICLLPALLWEWYRREINNQKSDIRIGRRALLRTIFTYLVSSLRSPLIYLIPLGLVAYMVYLQIKFGDPLYFWHAQGVFGAGRENTSVVFPLQTVWRYIKIIATVSPTLYHYWTAVWELLAFVGGVIGLLIANRMNLRVSYLIFGWLAFLLPAFTGTFSSLPRYLLTVFPLYLVLASVNNRTIKRFLTICGAVLLVWFCLNFTRGWWVA